MTDEGPPGAERGRPTELRLRFRGVPAPAGLHWLALALAFLTGVIHLYVGWARARPSLALAGIGFFGGIALFLAGYRRRLLYAVGIGYVAMQIVLWAVFNAGEFTRIGYADKVVQVLLLGVLAGLLWLDSRR